LFIVPLRAAHTGQNLTINGFRLYRLTQRRRRQTRRSGRGTSFDWII
jgi:hypothetical protein